MSFLKDLWGLEGAGMFNGCFLAHVLRSLGAVPGRLAYTQELVPVWPVTYSCEQWPLVEGKVPSQVFRAFSPNKAWEGRGLSSPAQRGSRRARVSRDPRVRRYIPGSRKETRHKRGGEALAVKGRVLWELS